MVRSALTVVLLATLMLTSTASRQQKPYKFPDGLELKEAEACVDEPLLLACMSDQEVVVVSAYLYGEVMSRDKPCSIPSYNRQHMKGPVLHYLNHKCTSEQRCEFNTWDDVPGAASNLSYWQQGIIVAQYTCVNESDWVGWCGGVASGPSGWLRSPGYPKFYIGPEPCDFTVSLDPGQKMSLSFTDVQLKERDGGACRDTVTVQDESGRLYQRCGTLHRPELVQSEHHIINITLHTDQQMVPARGFLAYYKAFGCPNPPVPANATAVFRNASHAKLACRDGHAFVRDDDGAVAKYLMLECRQQMWPAVDDCVGLQELLAAGEITQDEFQRLFNETANVDILVKSHFSRILDYYIPVAIMTVLVLGNIIIILTIFYCRRALKEMASDEWDSIKSNPEPPDECDPDPTAPSRV